MIGYILLTFVISLAVVFGTALICTTLFYPDDKDKK